MSSPQKKEKPRYSPQKKVIQIVFFLFNACFQYRLKANDISPTFRPMIIIILNIQKGDRKEGMWIIHDPPADLYFS